MKNLILLFSFLFVSVCLIGQQSSKSVQKIQLQKQQKITAASDDGTPDYKLSVEESYRKLQYKMSIYGEVPKLGSGIRLGIYQIEAACAEGATAKNMILLEEAIKLAKKYDVQLLSFPELYVTGYTLSPDDAIKVAEYKDGPSITKASEIAKNYNMALLVPYAEKVDEPDGVTRYYDAIAVIKETGELLNSYRKTHLYGQQERDNWSCGSSDYPVYNIFDFPVGVLNCYECEFPELQRILALNGAKLIVGPTAADNYYVLPNGQRSAVPYPDISKLLIPANAYANNIFFAYSNRTGYEKRGNDQWHYRGNSIICGPHGDIIVDANSEQNTMLIADCVPAFYGMTHPAPDYYYLKDRRPELYKKLIDEKSDFLDERGDNVDLDTDFFSTGYHYKRDCVHEKPVPFK
ncbi:MAG: carbon-nitrogen hydrolase family protein [Bacteroidetes bacterium]|nr:carbon-nitrogen hydrolase family protein [Bacteroidota bacterium]MBL6944471.1 carbon-nitrogen hydrolase family protein [Bacteroidales bacterium]